MVVGLLTAFVSWWCGWAPDLPDRGAVLSFAGSIAAVASTMLGFMLAALAVLVSVMMAPTGAFFFAASGESMARAH